MPLRPFQSGDGLFAGALAALAFGAPGSSRARLERMPTARLTSRIVRSVMRARRRAHCAPRTAPGRSWSAEAGGGGCRARRPPPAARTARRVTSIGHHRAGAPARSARRAGRPTTIGSSSAPGTAQFNAQCRPACPPWRAPSSNSASPVFRRPARPAGCRSPLADVAPGIARAGLMITRRWSSTAAVQSVGQPARSARCRSRRGAPPRAARPPASGPMSSGMPIADHTLGFGLTSLVTMGDDPRPLLGGWAAAVRAARHRGWAARCRAGAGVEGLAAGGVDDADADDARIDLATRAAISWWWRPYRHGALRRPELRRAAGGEDAIDPGRWRRAGPARALQGGDRDRACCPLFARMHGRSRTHSCRPSRLASTADQPSDPATTPSLRPARRGAASVAEADVSMPAAQPGYERAAERPSRQAV